jgi:hypothetical protein
MDIAPDLERARQSLDGLSVGDAFGELMFGGWWLGEQPAPLPPGPWTWTDDTHIGGIVALSAEGVPAEWLRRREALSSDREARRAPSGPHPPD